MGKRLESSSILALMLFCRSSAFDPGIWKMPSTTVGSSPKKAVDEYCSAPSSMRATSRKPHGGAGRRIGAHDDVAELGGIAQPPDRIDLHFEGRAGRRRRLADLAGGDLDVLLGDRVLDVDRGDAERGELVGIEPDAHRVAALAEDLHVADARQALERVDHLQIGVIAQRHRIDRAVRRGEIDDQHEVRVLLLDRHAGLVDDRRQDRRRLRDAVLHVDRGDAQGIADLEGDGDRRRAVVRARRRHVDHAGHAVDLLLERGRHRVGDDLGAGAGIDRADDDLRRRDLRELRDRKQEVADRAREHHDDRDRGCEDRPFDEESDHGDHLFLWKERARATSAHARQARIAAPLPTRASKREATAIMLESARRSADTRARAGESPSKQPNAPTGHAFNCCPSTQRGRLVGLTPPCYWLVTSRCYRSVTFSQEVGTKKVFTGWLGGIAAPLRKTRAAMHQSRRAGGDYAVPATAAGNPSPSSGRAKCGSSFLLADDSPDPTPTSLSLCHPPRNRSEAGDGADHAGSGLPLVSGRNGAAARLRI